MRLISWHANCRFRDKYHLLDHFDVAVVQECEDPKQSSKKSYAAFADRSFWLGKIKHKGLGVFLGADTKAEIMLLPETTQEYFLPLQLSSGKQILAVWAMGAKRVQDGYIAQIHDYLRTQWYSIIWPTAAMFLSKCFRSYSNTIYRRLLTCSYIHYAVCHLSLRKWNAQWLYHRQ